MKKQYLIYSDESFIKGKYYSNFYGGALLEYQQLEKINKLLNDKKQELHLFGEIKWTKVTANYLDKYIEIINLFFELIRDNKIKIRIMFRQNAYIDSTLTHEHFENQYQILYYEFIKYAFGLDYCNENEKDTIFLKFYLDQLPDTIKKNNEFKEHILQLNSYFDKNININKEDIVEIDSKNHVVQQCMDIILGSINYRLNDLHKQKIEGTNKRGKATIAKEKLYKVIYKNICTIYPNFNIGITTSIRGCKINRWLDPYRHWKFQSKNSVLDKNLTKKK